MEIINLRSNDIIFILALDSSASLKFSKESEQAWAIIEAVPNFIEKTISKYPNKNFNISIVSWDNDTDFAYKDFNNKYPKNRATTAAPPI